MSKNTQKEITLSDGRKAMVGKGTGRNLLNAQKKGSTAQEIQWALLAEITEVDGKKIPWEDYLEMPLEDVFLLFGELAEKFPNLSSLPRSTSSISQG